MARYKRYYGGGFKKGRIDMVEAAALVAFVIFGIGVFGLGSINLTWVTDFGFVGVVVSALVVFAKGKEKKSNRKITAIEIGALAVAIGLPLAAAGYLTSVGIDISTYLADATNAFIMLIVSVGALIVAASQD